MKTFFKIVVFIFFLNIGNEYAHSTDGMSFKTNGAQRVTIDSSGNMGVQGRVSASGFALAGLTALP